MQRMTAWGGGEIFLHQGNLAGDEDLAAMQVEAIVNAANPWLCGGGGVDGAIHQAGGPSILEECQRVIEQRGGRSLECGEAVVTGAGKLPVSHVIHAVGPVYYDMTHDEACQQLQATYRHCLEAALERNIRSIAFPCISTGAYGFPADAAGPLALAAVRQVLEAQPGALARVVFCVFGRSDREIYAHAFANLDADRLP
jgi:O-acetyl-ADP-ribose deacetylase